MLKYFKDIRRDRFCDPMKKKNWCDVTQRIRWSYFWRTFLKLSLKMPSSGRELECYNRKLCVNKQLSLFSQLKCWLKMAYQLLKIIDVATLAKRKWFSKSSASLFSSMGITICNWTLIWGHTWNAISNNSQ